MKKILGFIIGIGILGCSNASNSSIQIGQILSADGVYSFYSGANAEIIDLNEDGLISLDAGMMNNASYNAVYDLQRGIISGNSFLLGISYSTKNINHGWDALGGFGIKYKNEMFVCADSNNCTSSTQSIGLLYIKIAVSYSLTRQFSFGAMMSVSPSEMTTYHERNGYFGAILNYYF